MSDDHGLDRELSGPFGPVDAAALAAIRSLVVGREPLVARTAYDDSLDPQVLYVEMETGLNEPGRFDVRWSERGNYSIHYTETAFDFRFDRHPNPHGPGRHVHLPPDAKRIEPSCIAVERPELVALAVLERWRAVLERCPGALNEGENPP